MLRRQSDQDAKSCNLYNVYVHIASRAMYTYILTSKSARSRETVLKLLQLPHYIPFVHRA